MNSDYPAIGTEVTFIKNNHFTHKLSTFLSMFFGIAILVAFDTVTILEKQASMQQLPTVLGTATPDSTLTMSATGILKDEVGNYLFPAGDISVLLNLEGGSSNQIDSVEAVVHYDPTVLSAVSVDTNQTLSTQYLKYDPMKCNPIYIEKNPNGTQTGTIRITRTAIPLPAECPPALPADDPVGAAFPTYNPVPKSTVGTFAAIKFTSIKNVTTPSLLSYEYQLSFPNPSSALNDSNVVAYVAPADRTGSSYDVLNKVINLSFLVGPQPQPVDNTPPVVDLTTPLNGAVLAGSVELNATASDDKAVSKVDFIIDGIVKCSVLTAPYKCTVDTSTYSNGTTHSISAKAYDSAQPVANAATDTITVSVCNGDCIAPTAPTNLVSSNITFDTVNLAWTASTDNTGISGYFIYRKKASESNFSQIGTTTTQVYTDTSVNSSTEYNYYVKAFDAAQNFSPASNTITAKTTIAPDTTAPDAPSNLDGEAVSVSQINLDWDAASDNAGGTGIAGYNIYRKKSSSSSFEKVNSNLATETNFGDSSLSSSTEYTYYVTAVDKANNESGKSNEITTKTQDEVVAKGGVAGIVTDSATGAPLANVKVTASNSKDKKTTVTDSNGKFTITDLTPGAYSVKYSVSKYVSQTTSVSVANGNPSVVNVSLVPNQSPTQGGGR